MINLSIYWNITTYTAPLAKVFCQNNILHFEHLLKKITSFGSDVRRNLADIENFNAVATQISQHWNKKSEGINIKLLIDYTWKPITAIYGKIYINWIPLQLSLPLGLH